MARNIIFTALREQFEVQQTEALATLTSYINNSENLDITNGIGLGQYPPFMSEMMSAAISLAEADSVIASLDQHYPAS
jgi:hypothetical protein